MQALGGMGFAAGMDAGFHAVNRIIVLQAVFQTGRFGSNIQRYEVFARVRSGVLFAAAVQGINRQLGVFFQQAVERINHAAQLQYIAAAAEAGECHHHFLHGIPNIQRLFFHIIAKQQIGAVVGGDFFKCSGQLALLIVFALYQR